MATENGKHRVAVVGGAGDWGRRYTWAYANHPDADLVAIVDTAVERRRVFAQKYGIPNQYDTVDDLLAHDIPDIVAAILPVSAAYDAVIACAEAGVKGVSCEKPIAARLSDADEMVETCRKHGVVFACGNFLWEIPFLQGAAKWVQNGGIGNFTKAYIDGFLANGAQVSGSGCVILNFLRYLTGSEVEWVEGWTTPDEAAYAEEDCSAHGLLGLSCGIVCEAKPEAPKDAPAVKVALFGDDGAVWMPGPQPNFVQGVGEDMRPVAPEFLNEVQIDERPGGSFLPVVESLMRCVERGEESPCSGHDYRQVLEIAIALKLSASEGHRRVSLPLEDRSLRIAPTEYRWKGGDVTGWQVIGRKGDPEPL